MSALNDREYLRKALKLLLRIQRRAGELASAGDKKRAGELLNSPYVMRMQERVNVIVARGLKPAARRSTSR